ncbi:hypothetical protein ACHAW5_004164 [Stephanodiscus triporus]|uniref:Potassium channel domain-containing protein n=1 Tax=Stephanodiscus triporus TaxID=2934178 RepID=A0ABD3PMZ2_9STRA
MLILSISSYTALGWLVYCLWPGNRLSVIDGFFESITIGWSVGLAPRDSSYQLSPTSILFVLLFHFRLLYFFGLNSTARGVEKPQAQSVVLHLSPLIALLLTKAGDDVEEDASINMLEALRRREDYDREMRTENPPTRRLRAFVRYNAAYLSAIALWMAWVAFIVVWSIIATSHLDDIDQRWEFARAQYFAISLCSSGGSMPLPRNSPDWAYLLAGISMMVGVPLMALAVSCVVIMLWQDQRFRKVQASAWEPITDIEMEALESLGLAGGVGGDAKMMTRGDFVLLGLLRMGQDGGMIGYLSNVYDARERAVGLQCC